MFRRDLQKSFTIDNISEYLIEHPFALHDAVRKNNIPLVLQLIEFDPELLALADEEGKKPIELAAELKLWDIVKLIAQSKKDTENHDYNYGSALYEAVIHDKDDIAKILLEANASLTWRNKKNGYTLLHYAIKKKNIKLIELLLKYNAKLSVTDNNDMTPIQLAADLGLWHIVTLIAQSKNDTYKGDYHYGHVLLLAVKNDQYEIAEILLKANATFTWFHNNTGYPLLYYAFKKKNIEMIKILLAYGADLSAQDKGKSPIELAAELKLWNIVKLIAQSKKDTDGDDYHYGSALLEAVINDKHDIAKILLEANASLNWFKKRKWLYSFALCCREKNIEMIKLLLAYGADLSAKDRDDNTPIELAAKLGLWNIVKLIAQTEKDTKKGTYKYAGALYCAVLNNQYGIAKLLLESNAKCNWSNKNTGNTFLHIAVIKNTPLMIALLLNYEERFASIISNAKQTPLQLAEKLNFKMCQEAIKNPKAFLKKHENKDYGSIFYSLLKATNKHSMGYDLGLMSLNKYQNLPSVENLIKQKKQPLLLIKHINKNNESEYHCYVRSKEGKFIMSKLNLDKEEVKIMEKVDFKKSTIYISYTQDADIDKIIKLKGGRAHSMMEKQKMPWQISKLVMNFASIPMSINNCENLNGIFKNFQTEEKLYLRKIFFLIKDFNEPFFLPLFTMRSPEAKEFVNNVGKICQGKDVSDKVKIERIPTHIIDFNKINGDNHQLTPLFHKYKLIDLEQQQIQDKIEIDDDFVIIENNDILHNRN